MISTETDTVTGTVTMQNENPFGLAELMPSGDLAIPTIDFATGDGCVKKITTAAPAASGGCIVTNAAMGNYASRIDFQGSTMWLTVPSPDFTKAALRSYDLTTSTLAAAISPASEIVGDVVDCPDGSIVIADTAMATGGLRVYRNGAEVTTTALNAGLTPGSTHGLVCD